MASSGSIYLGTVTVANPEAAVNATIVGPLSSSYVACEVMNAHVPVNVSDGSGNVIGSSSGSLNCNVTTSHLPVSVSDGSNNAITSTASALDINIKSGSIANTSFNVGNFARGTVTMWSAASVANTDTSTAGNLSAVPYNILTIYGNSTATATLTLEMSNDGTTYYQSQYNIASTGGDFGFALECSAYYVRLIASSIVTTSTISAFANYA